MFDVAGQRSERKKWLKCFDQVVTIIFVAAINEYDQFLFEAGDARRTEEAITVWEEIVNKPEFVNIGFLLFMNKWDLFEKKVLEFPYRDDKKGVNVDYDGELPDEVKAELDAGERTDDEALQAAILSCAEHVRNKFYNVIGVRTGYGTFTSHFTTAISTEGMNRVFEKCQVQILRKNLIKQGLDLMVPRVPVDDY